jgi:hypothetical protein
MYMSRFGVKNYKCLADVDIPLTPIHVLIGPNDAGKTSLLEALGAFFGSVQNPLSRVFPEPWRGRELVFNGSREPRVCFEGRWQESERSNAAMERTEVGYYLSFSFLEEGQRVGGLSEFTLSDARLLDFPTSVVAPTPDRTRLFRYREMVRSGYAFSPGEASADSLLRAIRNVDVYTFDPGVMASPAAIDLGRKFRLHPDGFGLPTLLMDILGSDPARFTRLRDDFCQFFPQFKTLRAETEQGLQRRYQRGASEIVGHGIGYAIYFDMISGGTVRAEQASDGAILMLGFLALAHLPDPPTLLLIEEPENGIYPKRLGEVIQMLKQMVHRKDGVPFPQIIMTTHSPYVLSFFEPEEVTFLSRDPKKPEAGVRARPLRDAPNIRERLGGGAFYLGELWYNLSEEELFGEP